VRPE
jgi:hypothetical protein